MVMERMDCSLAHLLRPHGPGTLGRLLPLPTLLHIATDIARGLAYLHPTVVHRDLKPGNVLLNSPDSDRPTAKLTDFGLSRLRSINLQVGTPTHMAPEVFDATSFAVTHKVDIYALGVVMWELVTGCVPWSGLSLVEIAVAITIQKARLPLLELFESDAAQQPLVPAGQSAASSGAGSSSHSPRGPAAVATAAAGSGGGGPADEEWDGRSRCPPRLAALITQCWEHDPRRRPAAAEVVKELVSLQQEVDTVLQRQRHAAQRTQQRALDASAASGAGPLSAQLRPAPTAAQAGHGGGGPAAAGGRHGLLTITTSSSYSSETDPAAADDDGAPAAQQYMSRAMSIVML
ncbi:hypothetical protein HXX76_012146 [Chlamydomonas incerta]|uniref:Protein kinase domain-containing protein n=1 Tax=Chlamydomonas incerta TaxID=51695 RepID=A0A835SIW5_CHLIN|nr:hypothetical protein HXX76_012146 [Chlamydomonas incerta]|eukprot:KAG2427824.1 hypothetical protein HXX76_012146 [Chlamydomonas incerta]